MKTILLILGLLTIPAMAQTPTEFGALRLFSSPFQGANDVRSSITIRDYIAIQAMNGLLSGPDWRDNIDLDKMAVKAYAVADAMLKARER